MIWDAERPLVYAGGGIIAADASAELREFVELIDAPAVCTLMGLGGAARRASQFREHARHARQLCREHGHDHCDVLIALGVRFDDRVTGRLAAFAPHAKVIHVDIDPAEIGKNRAPDVPIVGDVKRVLEKLNKVLAEAAIRASAKTPAPRARLVEPDPRLARRASRWRPSPPIRRSSRSTS